MYTQFYQLETLPFSIAPNPRFLFLTKGYQAVLSELEDAINGEVSLSVLLGEVGTGKTTLSRALLEDLSPEIRTALILNPRLTPAEFIQSILDELQVDYEDIKRSIRGLRAVLTRYIASQKSLGHRILVIVDEAQQLHSGVLEQIESMILEFGSLATPLSFILVGQPELDAVLKRPRHQELYELIAHHCALDPMTLRECQGYIAHRLGIAGTQKSVFTPRALGEIHQWSSGIPRLVNLICDRSLLLGYASNRALINSAMVKKASEELKLRSPIKKLWLVKNLRPQFFYPVIGVVGIVILMAYSMMPIKNYLGAKTHIASVQNSVDQAVRNNFPQGMWFDGARVRIERMLSHLAEVMKAPAAPDAHQAHNRTSSSSALSPIPKAPKPQSAPPASETSIKTEKDQPEKKSPLAREESSPPRQMPPEILDPPLSSVSTESASMMPERIPEDSLAPKASSEAELKSQIPDFLLWVKQGVEPLAERAKFSDWIAEFFVAHRDAQLGLFRTWIPKLPETSKVSCENAKELGLVCGHFWGQWPLLREINLPVLLEIRLSDGRKVDVLVRKEEDQQMTLLYGNSEAVFPTSEVLSQWTGRATIIGRDEPLVKRSTSPVKSQPKVSPEIQAFSTASGLGERNVNGLLAQLGGVGRIKDSKVPHLDDPPLSQSALCRSLPLP